MSVHQPLFRPLSLPLYIYVHTHTHTHTKVLIIYIHIQVAIKNDANLCRYLEFNDLQLRIKMTLDLQWYR